MRRQECVRDSPNVKYAGQLHGRDATLLVRKITKLTLEVAHLTLFSWLIFVLMFNVCCDRRPCGHSSVIETH